MDFIDQIKAISQQIQKLKEQILTEEATKSAFVMPFINALGYNVFNPTEVCPEFTADVPGLKGEKVDYAIIKDNSPIILIECKWCGGSLENPKHSSQLHRYFHATEAKFGVLTNGIIYRFYTDTEKSDVMDEKPFFEFNMIDFNESIINELKRFSKLTFNPSELCDVAKNMLYTTEIKRLMAEQLFDPSPDFVKFFAGQVYTGKLVASVVEKFTEITKRSLKEFINDRITDRLKSAIDLPDTTAPALTSTELQDTEAELVSSYSSHEIITTEEELEGFYIIKAILREIIPAGRVQFKNTKSYFGINIDGKVSKTICRLWLNPNKRVIGILDAEGKEARKTISSIDEIYGLAEILKDRTKHLIQGSVKDSLPPELEK
ncbi:type I restriction enzyme HsdR N-terminal domain-containing protein [Gloeocapsopsis crepidinum LEGE 06123]|uniref:Type I restriction enzyme HsdR N-terminal domain-containing protein n=1 Tax=Gloeocapsopsis crepidinum LEGE 06123 TaxID=588587 RepID=A0ABR9UYB5_9CHRO|nr:type I restriction endonuclease [Gloeocapsopsis crepidinum]MBE9192980.1 type I restriction enzyme HsdR N-terminal domain-containing protein [Gloeocapsopsis crepidinum LEGE 06123]